MFERECNRNLFDSLTAALEQRTEKSLEALLIELRAWKRTNNATMKMTRTPKNSFGKRQTQSPTAGILCAMGEAAEGNWSSLEKIYNEWRAVLS